MDKITVTCDSCGNDVDGLKGPLGTAGFYPVGEGSIWTEFGRPGEEIVCDNCMHVRPEYQAEYGDYKHDAHPSGGVLTAEGDGGSDRRQGLYSKYQVIRTDGSSAPGGKHEKCYYFVLDVDHDPFSIPALLAYADACEEEYPTLARDLRLLVKNIEIED